MQDVTNQLANAQVIEIWVTGPDGANRMFVCSGFWPYGWGGGTVQTKETFTFHVGPSLGRREFIRTCCAAGPTGVFGNSAQGSAQVSSSDADWDDEDGRVQVTLELQSSGSWGIYGFHYNVTILAEKAGL